MAYQIAFDLYESATQQFLNIVVQAVRKTAPVPEAVEGEAEKERKLRKNRPLGGASVNFPADH